MTYPGYAEEGKPGFLDILLLVISIVVFIIVISMVVIALSPLDLTGDLRNAIPYIVVVIALMITTIIIVIIAVYIPDVITRGR